MSKENRPSNIRKGPFGGGHGGNRPVEKARNFKGTMLQLIKYLKPFYLAIIVSFIFAIGSTVFMIVGPKILGKATTTLAEGFMLKVSGQGGIDFNKIAGILIFLIILYVISSLFSYVQNFLMSGVAQKVSYNLRKALAEKINRLPFKFFDQQTHGEVLSRITNDVDMIAQTLNQSLSQMITSIVQLIGIIVMMLTISWQMTLMAMVVLPLSVIMVTQVIKHSQKFFARQQESLGNVNGHIEEMYSGHM
ncbi:MAG: ABC transporter ATP-binding protein, partial [Erysipelotrichaceae bacterium]